MKRLFSCKQNLYNDPDGNRFSLPGRRKMESDRFSISRPTDAVWIASGELILPHGDSKQIEARLVNAAIGLSIELGKSQTNRWMKLPQDMCP